MCFIGILWLKEISQKFSKSVDIAINCQNLFVFMNFLLISGWKGPSSHTIKLNEQWHKSIIQIRIRPQIFPFSLKPQQRLGIRQLLNFTLLEICWCSQAKAFWTPNLKNSWPWKIAKWTSKSNARRRTSNKSLSPIKRRITALKTSLKNLGLR